MAVNGTEIAVGQRWKTRGGGEVVVINNDCHRTYPWIMSTGASVTNEGIIWEGDTDRDDLCTLIQDEHGFIRWGGGECPVPDYTEIEAKLRCGDLKKEVAEWFDWYVDGGQRDIVAYRAVKQQDKPKQKKESALETTIETMEEPKYTVEQVFKAINEATDDLVMLTNLSKVKAHLAKAQDPDYKLYLTLKARFE